MRLDARWALSLMPFLALGAQSTPRVRDSAGVRIIENSAKASAPVRFVLGDKPVIDVGGLEDVTANEFNHRNGYLRAVQLSNGGLAVIDMNRVHFFDATGKRTKIVGRDGDGPGEFRYVTAICRTRGDTIVVSDDRTSRLGIIDGAGNFVRHVPRGESMYMPFNACLMDGTYVVSKVLRNPDRSSSSIVTRHRLDGSRVDSIGVFDRGLLDMSTQREAQVFGGPRAVYFADGFGDVRAIVTRDMLNNASKAELQLPIPIDVLTGAGRAEAIIRTADPAIPVTNEEREKGWRATIPTNVSAEEVKQRMERMRSMPSEKYWPAHRRAHIDDDGRLWLEDEWVRTRAERAWTAFDASGRLIGRLIMPQSKNRVEVVGFGKNRMIVARTDDDGARHITVYPILPAGR